VFDLGGKSDWAFGARATFNYLFDAASVTEQIAPPCPSKSGLV
jgi:hypothetical protein